MSSLTFLHVFLESLYVFYFLFFLGRSVSYFSSYFHPKPSLHKLELEQFPPVDKALALPVLLLCELIRNCKILRISVQLQSHQFDFPLKTRVANYLLTRLHIYLPTSSPRAMPNCVPAVRYTETLEYAHFTVICRYLLAHTNEVSKLRTQSRLRITFSLALPLRYGSDGARGTVGRAC